MSAPPDKAVCAECGVRLQTGEHNVCEPCHWKVQEPRPIARHPSPSGVSDRAFAAARGARTTDFETSLHDALEAAHSPSLGTARSVCLQDVLDEAERFERMPTAQKVREGVPQYFSDHLRAKFGDETTTRTRKG